MAAQLKCIMLVDGDTLTNFLNKMVIDNAGIAKSVVRVESANSAIHYLYKSHFSEGVIPFPELIFLDINMPDQTSWGFIKNYKEISVDMRQQTKIVLLATGVNLNELSQASDIPEVTDLYSKPLTSDILTDIVTNYYTHAENKKELKPPGN